ncbi:MAG: uroporphyrinogen-III synthase [Burkholderiales bacterium]|nr:uroporphyrinogen-III synthase [Burkholderiales bacterium]
MSGPLAGRRVLVTRPAAQAEGLARRIRAAGGEAIVFPTIEILPPSDPAALGAVLSRLEGFDLAIFVSRNAVERGLAALARPWPARLRVAAVGAGTARALAERGVGGAIVPAPGLADSEALLARPELADVRGARIVVFRGEGGRETLREQLEARGARVEYAECYRRARPQLDSAALLVRFTRGEVDAVTANSAEALENLCAFLGEAGLRAARATPLFVPHSRVARAAAARGFARTIVAGPGDEEVCATLMAYFAQRPPEAR